jgi:hypothetical protein
MQRLGSVFWRSCFHLKAEPHKLLLKRSWTPTAHSNTPHQSLQTLQTLPTPKLQHSSAALPQSNTVATPQTAKLFNINRFVPILNTTVSSAPPLCRSHTLLHSTSRKDLYNYYLYLIILYSSHFTL